MAKAVGTSRQPGKGSPDAGRASPPPTPADPARQQCCVAVVIAATAAIILAVTGNSGGAGGASSGPSLARSAHSAPTSPRPPRVHPGPKASRSLPSRRWPAPLQRQPGARRSDQLPGRRADPVPHPRPPGHLRQRKGPADTGRDRHPRRAGPANRARPVHHRRHLFLLSDAALPGMLPQSLERRTPGDQERDRAGAPRGACRRVQRCRR